MSNVAQDGGTGTNVPSSIRFLPHQKLPVLSPLETRMLSRWTEECQDPDVRRELEVLKKLFKAG